MALSEAAFAEDLTRAMKARDMSRVYVLRGLLTAAKNLKVERRGAPLTEADLVQLVRREIRQREEAADFAAKAGREETVAQNRAEQTILAAYVPAPLETSELEAAIRVAAREPGGQSIGAIMATLRARYAGRFDGKTASELARRVLSEDTPA